jgi:hypothetical protein
MLPQDFNFADRLLAIRVEEEQRRSQACRLQLAVMGGRRGRLFRLRCWLLNRIGHFMVVQGKRRERPVPTQTLSVQGRPNRGS